MLLKATKSCGKALINKKFLKALAYIVSSTLIVGIAALIQDGNFKEVFPRLAIFIPAVNAILIYVQKVITEFETTE